MPGGDEIVLEAHHAILTTDAGSDEFIESVVLSGGIVEGESEDMLTEFAGEIFERGRHDAEALGGVSDGSLSMRTRLAR